MSKRFTKEDLDTQFDAFLRDSVSSDESLNKYLKKPSKKERKPHWYEDEDDDDSEKGLSLTGSRFLRSKKTEDNVNTETENSFVRSKAKKDAGKSKGLIKKSEISLSRDSLEDISEKSEVDNSDERRRVQEMAAHASYTGTSYNNDLSLENLIHNEYNNTNNGINNEYTSSGHGIDTLNEMAHKEQFFRGLEENGDHSVDYNKLIGDISGTTYNPIDTKPLTTLDHSNIPHLLVDDKITDSHNASMDKDSSHQKPSMLSKVSLLDSMDSTLNTTTSPKVGGSRDRELTGEHDNIGLTVPGLSRANTGTEFMGTNTSKEIEDLHEAMREVGRSTTTTAPQPLDNITTSQDQLVDQLFNTNNLGNDRPVSEIFRDIDNIEAKQRDSYQDEVPDIKLLSDYKTQLPISQYKKGSPSSISEDIKQDGAVGGFDHSHTEDTEVYQPVINVSVKDKSKVLNQENKKTGKPRHRYEKVQSSGYGRRSPSVSPIRSPSRPLSEKTKKLSQSSPNISNRYKTTTKLPSKIKTDNKGNKKEKTIKEEEKLLASVDYFARHLKGQISGKPLPTVKWSVDEPSQSSSIKLDQSTGLNREQMIFQELKDLQEQWKQVNDENNNLKANLTEQDKLHIEQIENLKLQHEQELFKIKQENFVLAAKNQADEDHKQIITAEGLDNVAKEKINKLEKEIKEQENLIAGYEKENQRLCSKMKLLEVNTKDTEGTMFKENQRLTREVAQLRDLLSQKEYQLKNKGIITSVTAQQQIASSGNTENTNVNQPSVSGNTRPAVLGANRISELEAQLKDITKQYSISERELKTLQCSKLELEEHIDKLIREREDLTKQLQLAKSIRPEEAQKMEEKYTEEIDKLSKKLKWYTKNQELLDKSAMTIRFKDSQIEKLKKQVEELQSETGRKMEENKLRAKERAAEHKKVQDLERQVREMEQIVRKRHPNSLPAMILAAGVVNDTTDSKQTPSNIVLENRIKKLENELSTKDNEHDQLLRAMEQKYNMVKMQFEERINTLQDQLLQYQHSGDHDRPHTHITALQKELDSTRDRYKKQISELQTEIIRLQTELNKSHKHTDYSLSRFTNSTDSELQHQVLLLQRELENKSHDLQVIQISLDKLRKEKQLYLKDSKKGKSKKNGRKSDENNLDEHHDNMNSNVTEVVKENDYLKNKVERLQLSLDQQRVDLRKSLAETEAFVRKSREEYEDKIDTLRSSHQKEFQRVLAEQAVSNSTSKVAELHSKCDAQEVLIRHLKEQLSRNEVEAEQISVLKIREASLLSQIEKIKDELAEAKRHYTPGMKHFMSIQEKIEHMERRHLKREEELQDIIKNTQNLASSELDRESEKWRRIVEVKNNEIEKFRSELDSILNVIRMLQQQGVVLPTVT